MRSNRRHLLSGALILLILAAPPRLAELGALSFYADEETSAFPARALAEGEGVRMPSGMPYLRALPLTWLTAASVRLLGPDAEVSYRLPVALIGIFTVPLLLWLGWTLAGSTTAAAAALLLAGSEWHIVFSRQARMYAPMLFFVIAAAIALWSWSQTGRRRDLLLAFGAVAVAVSLHSLGVMVLLLALVPLVGVDRPKPAPWSLAAFTGVAMAAALAYFALVATAGYRSGGFANLASDSGGLSRIGEAVAGITAAFAPMAWSPILAAAGALVGVWLGAVAATGDAEPGHAARRAARYTIAAVAGAMAGAGRFYGAALALVIFLLLYPGDKRRLAVKAAAPSALLVLIALTAAAGAVSRLGVVAGVKSAAMFPFPYAVPLARQSPGIAVLFAAAALWLALVPHRSEQRGVRACVLVVIVGIAAMGAIKPWGGTRYLMPLYPFALIAAAAALVAGLGHLAERCGLPRGGSAASACALLVCASGVLGGHGAAQAFGLTVLRHGEPVNAEMHMFSFRPDHAAPGRFLAERRRPGDVLIAEDPLQMRWYAGPVDYWLRSMDDARQFLYRAQDGVLRDIYVNSAILDPSALRSGLADGPGRLWVVTSGETGSDKSHYLDAGQRRWLDSIQATLAPAFTGRDGVTRVYCLNCSRGRTERSDGAARRPRSAARAPSDTR